MPNPILFLSYSHDNERHKARVARFADKLKKELYCDVRIDRDVDTRVPNWPVWMLRQIREANFVLMVFTPRYRRCFDQDQARGRGRGVSWEGNIIQNTIYASSGDPDCKFIPIAFSEQDLELVPTDVFGGSTYLLPRDWSVLAKHVGRGGKPPGERTSRDRPARRTTGPGSAVQRKPNLTVLFVGAEKGTGLDLHGQFARTKAAVAEGRLGASVKMESVFNVTAEQMIMRLNRSCPVILHLSGRQENGQIKMHNSEGRLCPVPADILAGLLAGYHRTLRLIVLDTCESLPQASKVVEGVDCAIGVEAGITEPVAIDFFAMFFNALSSGQSVRRAFDVAYGLQMAKIQGSRTYLRDIEEILDERFDPVRHLPRLVTKEGIDPAKVILVR